MKLAGGSWVRCRATGHLCLLAWAPRSEWPLTALPHASFSAEGGRRAGRGACSLSCGLWPQAASCCEPEGVGGGPRRVLSHLSWGEGGGVWEEAPFSPP